jgi:hypothetical protein
MLPMSLLPLISTSFEERWAGLWMASMDSPMNSFSTISKIADIVVIMTGLIGLRNWLRSRPFKKPLAIFTDSVFIKRSLLELQGRTVNFDTRLDFSVWNEFSSRVANETEYKDILNRPASELNNKPLNLYSVRDGDHLDSFVRLVVSVKDSQRLKFSYGGSGLIYVLLKGRFNIEVRGYAGPSAEFTLRESDA